MCNQHTQTKLCAEIVLHHSRFPENQLSFMTGEQELTLCIM